MPVITRLACYLGKNNEAPNIELAKELAESEDGEGIAEIAAGLSSEDKAVQSDCIKVLYETGYLKPALISSYADTFIGLLSSKNNRLVWGAMIALGTIAGTVPETIIKGLDAIKKAMENGSVITMDNGVKALALAASKASNQNKTIFQYLITHLKTCRSKEIPQHAESTFPAVSIGNRDEFVNVLHAREAELTPPQQARVKKLYKMAERLQ